MEKLKGINIDEKDLKWHKKLGEGRDAIIYAAFSYSLNIVVLISISLTLTT